MAFAALDIPRENTPVSDIYARYRPQRIEIAGAQEHPTPLVESIAMASVAPPAPSSDAAADLRLPGRLIEEGHLSEAQLETIVMANDAHERDLPGRFTIDEDQTRMTRADDNPDARAYRLGCFLGDGTGCGKGRECAGLILVNWLAGRRKAVWISKFATLIEDAIRDWTDLGGSPADIQPLSKWKPDQLISMGDGILFVTYATLRSAGKCGTTRLGQILECQRRAKNRPRGGAKPGQRRGGKRHDAPACPVAGAWHGALARGANSSGEDQVRATAFRARLWPSR